MKWLCGNQARDGGKIMSKQIRKEVSDQSQSVELNEQQLDMIAGGTKTIDKASPNLFKLCCAGEHIKTATIAP